MSRPFCVRGARPCRARPAPSRGRAAAKERPEEVGERILVAEEFVHLLFGHRAIAAGPPMLMFHGAAAQTDFPHHPGSPVPCCCACSYIRQLAPSSSYLRRFSGSPSTSYASLISLKRASAVLSPGIHVRMMLAGELPVRLLDLFVRSRLRDAEGLVVVLEFHRMLSLLAVPGPWISTNTES